MAKETKLHEVLAVEGDLEGQSSKILGETVTTFEKKAPHFMGYHKWLEMFDDERRLEGLSATERKEIVDTVQGKLDHSWEYFGKYLDVVAQKERTNQDARADLVVDGEVLIEGAPATLLLGLESRLKRLRDVYNVIPTLAPGLNWVPDTMRGEGVYKADHLALTAKTEKVPQFRVLVEPTKEHPAQVEKWMDNVQVGTFKTEHWSSMVSPAQKAEWLSRIDKLIRAVKRARQRANNTEVVNMRISNALKRYIHGGAKQ